MDTFHMTGGKAAEDLRKIKQFGEKVGMMARNIGAAALAGLSLGGADAQFLHANKAKGRWGQHGLLG